MWIPVKGVFYNCGALLKALQYDRSQKHYHASNENPPQGKDRYADGAPKNEEYKTDCGPSGKPGRNEHRLFGLSHYYTPVPAGNYPDCLYITSLPGLIQ